MLFDSRNEHSQKIIDCFENEFDTLWNSKVPEKEVKPHKGEAQTVSLKEGKRLQKKYLTLMQNKDLQAVQACLGKGEFKTLKELRDETKLGEKKLKNALNSLIKEGMLVKYTKKDKEGYSQVD